MTALQLHSSDAAFSQEHERLSVLPFSVTVVSQQPALLLVVTLFVAVVT